MWKYDTVEIDYLSFSTTLRIYKEFLKCKALCLCKTRDVTAEIDAYYGNYLNHIKIINKEGKNDFEIRVKDNYYRVS